jgi:hypothetical protein
MNEPASRRLCMSAFRQHRDVLAFLGPTNPHAQSWEIDWVVRRQCKVALFGRRAFDTSLGLVKHDCEAWRISVARNTPLIVEISSKSGSC